MRTKNSIKNIIMNFLYNFLNYGLRFASRIVFVKTLAKVYLGVNGLLSNVLGILALTELGIGTAIGYSLYEPLAKNNTKKVRSLMQFYKKAYRIIALVVLVLGLILLPVLPYLIKNGDGIENLNIIYIIFLLNMAVGYLFSYKRTLVSSDQKNYLIVPFTMSFNIITSVLQIVVLLLFKNYIVYLLVQSVCIVLENIIVNRYIDKKYPYLTSNEEILPIDKTELATIKTKIKALLLHKVGSYTLSSTDNLIISKLIGIVTVGIYSNYSLIINMISSFIYLLVSNVIASLGNLIASENPKKCFKVFNEMNFICFVLYGISFVCFINLFNPFIELAFGSNYLLTMPVVYIIVINFYLTGLNNVVISIQTASGLYEKDKYVPLIQSAVNLVISIYLGKKIGLAGVFIGTIISTFIPLIVKPVIVYKNVFKENVTLYFKDFTKQAIVVIISVFISTFIAKYVQISNFYINFVVLLLISLVVPCVIIFIVFHKNEAYKNVISRIKHIFNNITKKIRG